MALKPSDKVKTGSILDIQGFLSFFNNLEDANKVMKAFEDCGIIRFLSFNYQNVHKDEMLVFYLKPWLAEGRKIISNVKGKDVEIITDVNRTTFDLPPTTEVEVCSHTYNENEFWAVIKNPANSAEDMPS